MCKGTSYESDAAAKHSWQINKEKKIAKINGEKDKKEGKIRLKRAMTEWYDLYIRNKTTRGRPRSALTISTDLIQMGKIWEILGDKQVCDIDADIIQAYFNQLAQEGVGESILRKRWILLNMFFEKYDPRNNPMVLCTKPQTEQGKKKWNVEEDDETDSPLAYTDEQMKDLMGVLLTMPAGKNKRQAQERGKMLVVIMWQFLRLAEAAELRVRDIDLDSGIIRIRR